MLFRSPTVRVVAALSLTQFIGWGATYWLPAVTGPAMAAELGVPLPLIMAGPTIMLVIVAMVSWPLGGILERHGARPVMVLGAPLAAAGLMGISLATGPISYVAAWTVLGLAGALVLTTPAQIAVTEIAGAKARQALGILVLFGALTSTIIWPLSALMQAQWGWRSTTFVFAGAMLLISTPLHWTALARKPRETSARKRGGGPPAPIDRPSFLLLALSFAANGLVTWGFALSSIILLEALGLEHAGALAAAGFIGIAQWAGRMVDIVAGRRLSGLAIGLAGSALFPLSFAVLLVSRDIVGAMIFATLYGVAGGITTVARVTLPLHIFPVAAYARASAQLSVPLNLSFAAAPPVFAAIVTLAGPHAALWLAIGLSLVSFAGFVGLFLLHRGRKAAEPLQGSTTSGRS